MATSADPVASGWVKSLANPGGNVAGILTLSGELGLKRLEMLRAMVPKVSRVAMLVNGTSATSMNAVEAAISASVRWVSGSSPSRPVARRKSMTHSPRPASLKPRR